MKKRIVSMILALSMVLSILPVSAFADAGAGLSSAAAEETNSITYSSENEYEDVGTNSETKNQVVKIKIGTNGLPKAASGTGWSFDETTGLTITGTGSEDTEYILDGTVSCNVTVKNANSYTVYLLDGTVTGTLLIEADNMYGVYVLGGSYANVQLNLGTIDGGTYDKLTENGGNVRGGFFRDISGLSDSTQQQAHKLILPENCTLNGQKETGDIYIVKKYDYSGTGKKLELVVESDTPCEGWAVATTSSNGGVMTLPAGVTDYNFTYNGNVIAKISISEDGRTLSASFSMIPMSDEAPMKLVTIPSMSKELSFTDEGLPDLTGVTCVESLDEGEYKLQAYLCRNWTYACYPNIPNSRGILTMADQGGREIDFKELSTAPINCAVQLTNATITDAAFGEKGALVLTSGKITGGTYPEARVGISTTDGTGKVEITGGVFDSLSCYGECTISNAVILDCMFSTFFDNSKFAVSDTVFGALPDDLEGALAAGQKISKLVVRNGNVTAINGRNLTLSTNTIYLVGAGTADITLDTDVLSINEEAVENYNANTSADGKVLRITGKNDGAKIFVNKSTDPSDLKPLRITEKGLPDLTGVTGVPMSGEGMTANLYEGLGWKYATMEENGRTRAALYITTPDGNPVDLSSDTINPYHKAIAVEQITFANVTVTGIVAEGSVGAENTIIQDGTFQKDVYMDENSTIAGGTFQDVVRAYGKITGGAFIAEVQLNQNSEVTGGVFHDVQLPSYATEKTVIQNAVILGSLKTDSDSKAAISNTVSCGYIESRFLAAGQQQSKLMMTDGTVERLNDYAAATDAVYLIGNVKAEIRFSNAVTNINGEDVSAYNGAQLSADGKTLTLTAKNDGEPIVVNMATTGKLPFSSLSKSDFTVSGTIIGPQTVTSSKKGVGKLSLVYVRTYDNEVFETYPAGADMYGLYKQRIVAQEGDKYTEGSLDIGEVVRKYQPKRTDFAYDPQTQTAAYKGQMYFEDAPQYSIQYVAEDGSFPSVTKPTKAGTYSVYIVVNDSDHYDGIQYKVDTYTVSESKYTLTVDDKSTEHVAGEKLSFTAAEKDGYTFTGWKVTGLPTDVDTTKATISFTMPANNVTLKAQYTENAPKTYKLDVTDAQVTLKDGSAVADLTAVSVGTELKATADEDTETSVFKSWSCTGLELTEEQSTARVVYFTMPDHDVNLKAEFVTPTNKLEVTDAKVTLKDGGAVADLTAVPVGTELKAIAYEDTETRVFKCWTGLDLTEEQSTARVVYFTMPDHDVNLKAEFVTPTNKLEVTDAQVTLKDGGAVADLTAVPVGTELKATADEDTETRVFKNWNCTGLELTEEQSTARVVYFTMPDHDVNLKAEFVTPTNKLEVTDAQVTLKDGGAVADLMAVPVGTELVATADEDTETSVFKSWSCTGLELTEEQRTARVVYFTMPDHDVNLVAEFVTPTKPDPAPENYKLIVSYAKVTLKDGSAVADLKAVPMGTELKATADEDTETSVFKNWNCTGLDLTEEQRTAHEIYFTMPDHDVELTAVFEVPATPNPKPDPNPDPTPAPGGDSDGGGAAIVAVAAVGGAAIGAGAYIVGTTAYLKSVLPEGMAIPANRQQLAVALWTAAGKPATQSTALFNDVAADAAELQAIRWVVDTGLMSAQDGSFKPGSRVGRMEVIRTWKTYQQRG